MIEGAPISEEEDVCSETGFSENFLDFGKWSEFVNSIENFREEAAKIRAEHMIVQQNLNYTFEKLKILENSLEFCDTEEWKTKINDAIHFFKSVNKIEETKQLFEELEEKREHIKNVQRTFKVDVPLNYKCFICFDNPINIFLSPCGHACCHACWQKVRNRNCPACRTPVNSSDPIFLIS